MTTPETPVQAHDSNAHSVAVEPHAHAAANGSASVAETAASSSSSSSTEHHASGEASAGAADETSPNGQKKRRRRRKGKGPKPEGAVAADGQSPEAEGAEGEGGEAKAEGKDDGKGGKRRKKHRGPSAPMDGRERPAFAVGDVVFGRILDINEDAVLIDLSGKGLALFDRLEESITDEAPTPAEAAAHAAEEAAAAAAEDAGAHVEAAAPQDASSTESAAKLEAAPATGTAGAADAETATGAETPAETPAAEGAEAAEAASLPKLEPQAPLPPLVLEVGANFVGYVHNDGGRGGLVVLTRHPKRASKIKPSLAKAAKENTVIKGLVTGVIKGGAEVDVEGVRAFVPGSHMDLRPGADLSPFLAKRLDFHVTQYGKRGRDVVLSRKPFLEVEAKATREAALAKLKAGSIVDGIVRSVVPFGAFVDVGGVEGLVSLSEMSHNRSEGPNDVFKVGETTQVKILRIDERRKVWLSRKATMPDPWAEAAAKYAVGTRHTGKVVRLQPFGAFVELEAGIDGMIHVADLSDKRIEHPEAVVKVGDSIEVVIASNDTAHHKIALHPAPTGDAANEAPQRVALHKAVKVAVVAAETGGLQVRILGTTGRHARGFIPASATGTPRGTELRKLFPVGKELEAKIIELDPKRNEVKLSIRALTADSERNAYQQYRQELSKGAKFTFADLIAKKLPQR